MKKIFAMLLWGACLQFSAASNANAALLFTTATMVASNGSTTPITNFDLNGPAPWLYLDLIGTTGWIGDASDGPFLSVSWFLDGIPVQRFSLSTVGSPDHAWLSPTAAVWDANKAAGNWHISTQASGSVVVFCGIIYPGIICTNDYVTPGETIAFSVGATATPEPASLALFGLGAGLIGFSKRRKKSAVSQ